MNHTLYEYSSFHVWSHMNSKMLNPTKRMESRINALQSKSATEGSLEVNIERAFLDYLRDSF